STYFDKLLMKVQNIRNLYGPTEYTTYATAFKFEKGEKLSIGKPLDNTRVYILDSALHLCAKGVVGELCIGGDGLARGYLNRADLTCEKFVPNPFVEGDRIYRTGDLARWLPDGNIEFIGRNDDQVKIRGYRIELGEIEKAMDRIAMIDRSVVLLKEDGLGEKVLVGYIVCNGELNTAAIRTELLKWLPSYMIPSYFVSIAEMPLTSNGKLDKKALQELDSSELSTGISYVGPRNEVERQLIKVWEGVLGKQGIGINDDFFVIGGNSLKAGIVRSMIQKEFDIKVEFNQLYRYPTISNLSNYIASLKLIIDQGNKSFDETDELIF